MPQKILAGRADDPLLKADLVRVKVDQVILSKDPRLTLEEAQELGLRKVAVETAVAYDTRCVTGGSGEEPEQVPRSALGLGLLIARAGIGFPVAVHLERFAAPARLAVTDDPRLAPVGGAGMLTFVASPSQLAEILAKGSMLVRPPRSVQVLLSGKVRPFICVRDVALELLRLGLGAAVERVDREHGAPVVLEFAGPSARLLSVPDRAVLASLAPQLGAAAAVFVSDEKTEVYLRDQRRSKAHRSLTPDPGAPCDDVFSLDLGTVDPLLMDEDGHVRPVRDLEGRPVGQVVLGGDAGTSLRDLLAAAALLKSKRVPFGLDLLIAPPSRQTLEVLAQSGALVDLIATGARLIEPDSRVLTGELYPPPSDAVSLRTFDADPGVATQRGCVVASAETAAYAVATGEIGDPRSFKRPVRVTIPRALPTDDVLVVRRQKPKAKPLVPGARPSRPETQLESLRPDGWVGETVLKVQTSVATMREATALIVDNLNDLRWAARQAAQLNHQLRAVVATRLPTGMIPVFAGLGILALRASDEELKRLQGAGEIRFTAPDSWVNGTVEVLVDGTAYKLTWPAIGAERSWTTRGSIPARAAE